MCGIAGILSLSAGQSDLASYIKSMTDTLRHRGPDDEGFLLLGESEFRIVGASDTPKEVFQSSLSYACNDRIEHLNGSYHLALGHRRLSILDLSAAGHQPMCTHDEQIWITYNGEVYNYIELREELKGKGYKFKTNTDTEVLLYAYMEWGQGCLSKLNGMWAFVIYDRNKNQLFGARDRFGVKPFYYFLDGKFFAFTSEHKALLKLPFVSKEINHKAAFDYIVTGLSEPEEESLFKGILELHPSCAFTFNLGDGNFKKWKYYSLSYTDKGEKVNSNKLNGYSTEIRNLLFDAINIRLRSDVPVGSCLSGGLDSSVIVGIVNQVLEKGKLEQVGDNQKVFTASYDDKLIDESAWAKKVVEQTKTSWFQAYPTHEQLLEDLEDIVYYQDIPFMTSSSFAHYRVMKIVQEAGVKVTLDGQGGDEIFAGYDPYLISLWIEMFRGMKIKDLLREFNIANDSVVSAGILKYNLLKALSLKFLPLAFNKRFMAEKFENQFLNKDFWRANNSRLSILKTPVYSSMNRIMHDYINGPIFKVLLKTSERNAMRFSVESRTPFADDINLIEYMFQIPSSYKIYKQQTKYLMREAVKGIIPEDVRLRKDKMGFNTPEYKWLNHIKKDLRDYLTDDLDDFFDTKRLLNRWNDLFDNAKNTNTVRLWRIINFAVWKKVYQL
ncbi:asparagine synthase (glutamine-hydrolyzing) [Candidatus Amoebophilus asiaticus]|nr:asparagine synthase (glutamine-hydrolyzing) [Candidatus Amoebophilus asiaticus]